MPRRDHVSQRDYVLRSLADTNTETKGAAKFCASAYHGRRIGCVRTKVNRRFNISAESYGARLLDGIGALHRARTVRLEWGAEYSHRRRN